MKGSKGKRLMKKRIGKQSPNLKSSKSDPRKMGRGGKSHI